MAIYLLENEVGFDTTTIGFPSLMGCMAVVLQTSSALFGWHIYGSGNIEPRVVEFFRFIREHPEAKNPVKLFGTCNRQERFGGSRPEWAEEMILVARGLNFRGPVTGFDLGKGGIGHEGAYAEFTLGGTGTVSTGYKRWALMDSTKGTVSAPGVQQRVVKSGGVYAVKSLFQKSDGTDGVSSVSIHGGGSLLTASEGAHDSFTVS